MQKKNKKLFNIPLKNAEKTVEVTPWCKICNKKNNFLSTALQCQYCNHLNHKKCSNNDKNNTLSKMFTRYFSFHRNRPKRTLRSFI